ncbi:MAG: hypothetical protein GC204_03640 [Chloroflexi bacterium]|nr:hypothetical protein [Chloroflexota bacterium]
MRIFDVYPDKALRQRARKLMRVHPRMADYLRQAPVLVAGDVDGERLAAHCKAGSRLPQVMRASNVNTGLRRLDPAALSASASVVPLLREANPSAIAQQIARRDPAAQGAWLHQIAEAGQHIAGEMASRRRIAWFAERLPVNSDIDAGHCGDFFYWQAGPHAPGHLEPTCWRPYWRWPDLRRALRLWERTFVAGDYAGGAIDADEPLSPHAYPPDAVAAEGFDFILLNTSASLIEEGVAQDHCVGGYGDFIRAGRTLIYSMRQDGQRVATLQLAWSWKAERWILVQIKGRSNANPEHPIVCAAIGFSDQSRGWNRKPT